MKEPRDWTNVIDAISGDVRRLSYVVRYSSIPISVPENVAEHSYWVALFAAVIHKTLHPGDYEGVGPVVLGAILHDTAECVTGDLVRTFKYSSDKLRQAIDEAEQVAVAKFPSPILNVYDLQQQIQFKKKDYVKQVVKAADFMSLMQYMVREVRRGNREIINPFYLRMEEDLSQMRRILAEQQDTEWGQLESLYRDMNNHARAARMGG
jgi:5'-deoxynucleotidase YfbR-like HD superfamily hydrolase